MDATAKVEAQIHEVEAQIQEVESQIQGVEDSISQAAQKFLSYLKASEESLADYWRWKEEQLRKEKEQLRKKKELLRKEKEYLRIQEQLLEKENQLHKEMEQQSAGLGANIPISSVELRDCLSSLQQDVRQLGNDGSRTRSASKIAVEDFSILRQALKVVVLYEDMNGNKVAPEVLQSLVGEDKFWYVYERQQKDKYIAEVKRWVPEVEIFWADVVGHSINRSFQNAPFPVSGQNDQLAFVKGLDVEQGALLGLELNRKVLTMKGLRQAEVNFYLWGDCSLFPFVQVITDMQKGGVAMYCRSSSSSGVVLVQVVLQTMDEVKQFTQKVLSHPPSADNASYGDGPSEELEPPRKRFRPQEEPGAGFGDPRRFLWNFAAEFLNNDIANLDDLECFDVASY